jgi:hypothetical protein
MHVRLPTAVVKDSMNVKPVGGFLSKLSFTDPIYGWSRAPFS